MTETAEILDIQIGRTCHYSRIAIMPPLDEEDRAKAFQGLDGSMATDLIMANTHRDIFQLVEDENGPRHEIRLLAMPVERLQSIAQAILIAIGREGREINLDLEPKLLGEGRTLFSR